MAEAADVRSWLEGLGDERRAEAERLSNAVRAAVPESEAAVKWKRLTFTLDGDWHHWLCAVAASRSGVRLVFHKGALLDDPDGVLGGEGDYVREVAYPDAVTNEAAVARLLRQAAERRTEL